MPATIDIPTPTLTVAYAGETEATAAFRRAFEFFQRHGEGRYSDRTLMSINRWAQRSEELRSSSPFTIPPADEGRLPGVHMLASESSYDEVTEVKAGGVCAVAVTLPAGEGDGSRLVLAVAPESRRKGFGATLFRSAISYEGRSLHSWVGQGNVDGIKFLLDMGMFPQEMNRNNAICFGFRARNREQDGVAL